MVAFRKAIPNSTSLIFPMTLPLERRGPPIARKVEEKPICKIFYFGEGNIGRGGIKLSAKETRGTCNKK